MYHAPVLLMGPGTEAIPDSVPIVGPGYESVTVDSCVCVGGPQDSPAAGRRGHVHLHGNGSHLASAV